MLKHRVIPCLLLKDGGLVKTRKFKKPTYVGDPINAIRIFNEKEVDEIIVIDISASKNNREPDYELIAQFASECFMPLCYGGGIRNVEQAKRVIASGVEKICLQSEAIERPQLIEDLASVFGSQSIVLSVDVKKNWRGKQLLYNSRYRKLEKHELLTFVKYAVNMGAGEILLNNVDHDGEMQGYDLQSVQQISHAVTVPIIALGGAGHLNHFREAIDAGASAVAAGSMFVFHGVYRAVLISYPLYSELEELMRGTKSNV